MKNIPLTRGFFAVVDDADFERLAQHRWQAHRSSSGKWYARRWEGGRKNKRSIPMHAEILKASNGTEPDHKNGNGLDNRRENLREATHAQNGANRSAQKNNRSGFKGVSFSAERNKWVANLTVNGKRVLTKRFSSPVEAALAYDKAAIQHLGSFAHLNFPNHNGRRY